MLPSPQPAPPPSKRLQFPRTSTRLSLPDVYCKLIEDIVPQPFGCCRFDGRIYRPGAPIALESLPRPAVVIECTGPIGPYLHRRAGRYRDYGYILWTFDFQAFEWREIARAQAPDASWTAAIRELAWLALHPRLELVDIVKRSRDVSQELLDAIDKRLLSEMPEVKANALYSIYERVAGRIAECA
jgi:hypothetical protein